MITKNKKGQFIKTDIVLRFQEKVNKTDSCWLWIGWQDGKGYGKLRSGNKYVQAHRFSYEHSKGAIPETLTIDHLCRVRACVNPDHLEAVTLIENVMRGNSPAAIYSRREVCKNGHAFDRKRLNGRRACSICKHEYNQAYRAKNIDRLRAIGK